MYLKLISDVHVEWGPSFTVPSTPLDPETVLILAGDIDNCDNYKKTVESVIHSTNFLAYILIPGNHEYYGHDFINAQEKFLELEEYFNSNDFSNVWFSSTAAAVIIEDTTFIYGPMWTDGGNTPRDRKITQAMLSDFRVITKDFNTWTVDDMSVEFFRFVDCLTKYLSIITTPKTVLVTHHLPTYQAIAREFKTSPANGGFAVELSKYVDPDLLAKVDVMCFGHTHVSVKKKVFIGNKKVQLLCNPRGYPEHQIVGMETTFKNPKYDPDILFNLATMKMKSGGKKWFTPKTEVL
jgi:hypothetical protein